MGGFDLFKRYSPEGFAVFLCCLFCDAISSGERTVNQGIHPSSGRDLVAANQSRVQALPDAMRIYSVRLYNSGVSPVSSFDGISGAFHPSRCGVCLITLSSGQHLRHHGIIPPARCMSLPHLSMRRFMPRFMHTSDQSKIRLGTKMS